MNYTKSEINTIKSQLISICKKYNCKEDNVVIPEAYIPYIPEKWNGVLVLAESQNLSGTNNNYVDKLKSFNTSLLKINRLYEFEEYLKIEPWDDGTLKIAIEAALGVKADEIAVSNAVLWSQVTDRKTNENPSGTINELSTKIWKEFIDIMQPLKIITVGKIAKIVIRNIAWEKEEKEKWTDRTFSLRSPSKTYLSRISGMFDSDDLLDRFPKVKEVINQNTNWLEKKGLKKNKIFYACHAVSLLK